MGRYVFRPGTIIVAALFACADVEPSALSGSPEPGRDLKELGASKFTLDCPEGSLRRGEPPPRGFSVRCERVDGTPHGPFVTWWPNGVRRSEGAYEDGERHGPFAAFWEDGTPQQSTQYERGVRGDSPRLNRPDGRVWIERPPGQAMKWAGGAPPPAAGPFASGRPGQAEIVEKPDGVLSRDAVGAAERLAAVARGGGSVRLLVQVASDFVPEQELSGPAAVARQRSRAAAVQSRVLARLPRPAQAARAFETVPILALTTDLDGMSALLLDPDVTLIEEDIPVPASLAQSTPLIGATNLWAGGNTGAGWVVAVLDTGVRGTHSFLSGKVVSEACYSSNYALHGATSLCPGGVSSSTAVGSGDDCSSGIYGCGHGTHVAGIAAGKGTTFSGVAPDANVLAIQVFSRFTGSSCSGNGLPDPCALTYSSDQLAGLERVYALRNTFSIASANMSLGGGSHSSHCDSSSLKGVIDNLRAARIATVIASGNDGFNGSISSPACISTSVSVGATTKSDGVASYSNHASILRLLAPGSAINSSVMGGGFESWNGTSMAAPHVAGAWALMRSAQPSTSITDLLGALDSTATMVSRSGISKPRINVDLALATFGTQPPVLSPAGGRFTEPVAVTISSGDPSASIRYTIDGSEPTSSHGSVIASGGTVALTQSTQLKAVAIVEGESSEVVSETYILVGGLRVNIEPSAARNAGATWHLPAFRDDFETGDFTRQNWIQGGEAGWVITSASVGEGSFSAMSGAIGDNQSSWMALSAVVPAGEIRFRSRVSSEANYDFFYFYVNGEEVGRWSGEVGWTQRAYSVPAGIHTFAWLYSKDVSLSVGQDRAWVDDVILPGGGDHLSGTVLQGLADWSHPVRFAPVSGFTTTPADAFPLLSVGTTTVITGFYSADEGSLRVVIEPAEARTAGALWRVAAASTGWLESGATTTLPVGEHSVEFRPLDGWSEPVPQQVGIQKDQLTDAMATYVQRQVATPTFSPAPSVVYTSSPSISIVSATLDAEVRYTTDGSTPTSSSALYSQPILLPLDSTTAFRARAFRANWLPSEVATATYVVTGTVATPTFDLPAGTYQTARSVALATSTGEATIRYTLDGSEPTAASAVYSSPIPLGLDSTTTVKARAFRNDWLPSATASATYVITGTVEAPAFDLAAGTYSEAQSVGLSTATHDAVIRYTLDGSAPTSSSALYSSRIPLGLESSTVIRARAFRPDWIDSAVSEAAYVITGTVAAPTFDPPPAIYTSERQVSLSTSTPDATIRYTLDGSEPTASSAVYASPIPLGLDSTTTVKARAFRTDWAPSPAAEGQFVITGTVATPTFDLEPGLYTSAQEVALATATAGAEIRYTLDGSDPDASSPLYEEPIEVPLGSSVRIRARALRADWEPSEILDGTFHAFAPLKVVNEDGQPIEGEELVFPAGRVFLAEGGSGNFSVSVLLRDGNVDSTVSANAASSWTFHPPEQGAFAGTYLVTVTDTLAGWSQSFSLRVPLQVSATTQAFAAVTGWDDDPAPFLRVAGLVAGTELLLEVVNSEGTQVSGALQLERTVVTAAPLFEGTWLPLHVAADRSLFIRASTEHATGLSNPIELTATSAVHGRVVDAAGAPLSAVVEIQDLDQLPPWLDASTFSTGPDGEFDFRLLPEDVSAASLLASATGYQPRTVELTGCATEVGCAIVLSGELVTLSGTVLGLLSGESATVAAVVETAGEDLPLASETIVGDGSSSDAFALTLDSQVLHHRLEVSATGYLPASWDGEGEGILLAREVPEEVSIELLPTTPLVSSTGFRFEGKQAHLSAVVLPKGRHTEVRFAYWSDSLAETVTDPLPVAAGASSEAVGTLTLELACGTAHQFRVMASNDRDRHVSSEVVSFVTPDCEEEPVDPGTGGDTGCGCSSGAGTAGFGLLGLLVLLGRRRSRTV